MNARRKSRTFADHKPPLVAFLLVAMTSVMLLVHVARSDAAPGWLRHGVSVATGGPLQHVLGSTLVEPDPVVVSLGAPVVVARQPAATEQSDHASVSSAPSDSPASQPTWGPRRHQHGHATGLAAAPAGPALTSPAEHAPVPPAAPQPADVPGLAQHGHGPRGHGVLNGLGHLLDHGDAQAEGPADEQGDDDGPVRGAGHGHGHAYGHAEGHAEHHAEHHADGYGHGHGDGHGHTYGHGHANGHGHHGHGHH